MTNENDRIADEFFKMTDEERLSAGWMRDNSNLPEEAEPGSGWVRYGKPSNTHEAQKDSWSLWFLGALVSGVPAILLASLASDTERDFHRAAIIIWIAGAWIVRLAAINRYYRDNWSPAVD